MSRLTNLRKYLDLSNFLAEFDGKPIRIYYRDETRFIIFRRGKPRVYIPKKEVLDADGNIIEEKLVEKLAELWDKK